MKKGVVIFWSFWVFWACLRLASSLHKQRPDIGACLKQVVQGSGIIVEDPIIKDTGQIVVIRVHDLDASGVLCSDGSDDLNIRVKTKLYPRFKYGDEVSFSGKLDLPFNFKGSDGRVFDYEGLLAKDDIYYEIKSASITKSADPGSGFVGILYSIKRGFVATSGRF